jgi:hypothetical protein
MKTATTSLPDVKIVKIDSPTKKTLLGVNLHNPIWLLLQISFGRKPCIKEAMKSKPPINFAFHAFRIILSNI